MSDNETEVTPVRYWEREKLILALLEQDGSVALTEICEKTGASVATVRRDFDEIQKKGLAERTHGGLRRKKARHCGIDGTEVSDAFDREKQIIAAEAARQVSAGESIFIGAGKTCNFFASMLRDVERLTVVTTSVTAVLELAQCSGISVTLLGGDIHIGKNYIETLDPDVNAVLRGYYFDKVFVTVEGVDLERGYTVQDKNRTALYTQLSRMTRRLYMLLDSSKFERRAFATMFPPDKTCRIITTEKMPQKYADFYRKQGIPFTRLPTE